MRVRGKRNIFIGLGILTFLVFCGLYVVQAPAAGPIVGTWNYTTADHWSKGAVPAGSPSTGVVVITQSGNQFEMEFQSGMVFNPPQLKHFTGGKSGQEYVFSNNAKVDNEGGVVKNTCKLKMVNTNHFAGKSFSQYSNGAVTFNWGFCIALKR